jgi:chaperonin cofactor prefoldin
VIEEMSKLLEAAVPLDDVRSKKVLEVGKTLPGKFRAELSKFSTKIADLQRELSDKDAEIADLKESLRISRGKEINLPMPLECYTPRPNWPRIFDEVIPQLATAPLGRPGIDGRHPQHSTLNTQHSTLSTQHSTLSTQHSTLNTQHSALNTQHSALFHIQPQTLDTRHQTHKTHSMY